MMKRISKINMVLALILFCALFFYTANIYNNNSNMELGMANQDAEITIYTKPGCGYCIRAKYFLKEKNIAFREIDVSTDRNKHMELIQQTGSKTVPYIFIKDKYIGGCTDMLQMAKDGSF